MVSIIIKFLHHCKLCAKISIDILKRRFFMHNQLLEFIQNSPSMFHAITNLQSTLEQNGFTELKETEAFNIVPGGKYYVTRNQSSIIAFVLAKELANYHYQLVASHSDSPTFKLKAVYDSADKDYTKFNVEAYGGMISSTWFDRPLSIAGRVLVREENGIVSKLVNLDRDLLIIPNVAIHFNRDVNKGFVINNQVDMLPLFASGNKPGKLMEMVAANANSNLENVIAHDLYLYTRTKGTTLGAEDEFICSPKLDDLECAFTSFAAFTQAIPQAGINVACCFDNEEVGSTSKQGANGTFLADILKRINTALGKTEDEYYKAIAKSFMISADNAHAVHPNHPEYCDKENRCYMNSGPVVKFSANQKYTTDGISAAIFKEICKGANVPVQNFVNRSDLAGGSTLGNLANTQVSMNTVDIGLAQLAMHSAYETAGKNDVNLMIAALQKFYSADINIIDLTNIKITY